MQHILEFADLLLVLPEHGVLGVLVDLGFVLDVFGTVGVAEGTQRLVVVVVSGTEARHH